jgi:hypothetical protein
MLRKNIKSWRNKCQFMNFVEKYQMYSGKFWPQYSGLGWPNFITSNFKIYDTYIRNNDEGSPL